jgi:predicted PurR-regulated permease PerM
MGNILAAGTGVLAIIGIVVGILLIVAPLAIWSQASQIARELRIANGWLKHIAAATEETTKQVAVGGGGQRSRD